jgi:hypothetical protein
MQTAMAPKPLSKFTRQAKDAFEAKKLCSWAIKSGDVLYPSMPLGELAKAFTPKGIKGLIHSYARTVYSIYLQSVL